jgi:signal transduction histidine kinase
VGLGLSVAWRVVSEAGGTIDVRTEVGQGSCFTVWLPKA